MSILESRVRLVAVGGAHDGRSFPVRPPFLIGRSAECHLRPASDAVSLHHCAIENRHGRPVIVDLCSDEGTFVNGFQLMCDFPLRDGDELRVGPLQFLVRVYDLAKCTEEANTADMAIQVPQEEDTVIGAEPVTEEHAALLDRRMRQIGE